MKDLLMGIYALMYYKCLHWVEDCMKAVPDDECEWLKRKNFL